MNNYINKNFLVVGASYYQHYIYKVLKELGFKIFSVDRQKDAPMFKYSDCYKAIDIFNTDKITNFAKKNKIDYISTINIDQAINAVHVISKKLGFSFIEKEKLLIATNKELMRKYWDTISVNIPEFKIFKKGEFHKFKNFLNKKRKTDWIIKPIDNSAKRGVYKINVEKDEKNLFEFFSSALKFSKKSKCIVEEYIYGKLYFVPTYINSNKNITGVFEQEYNKRLVQIKYNAPAKLSNEEKNKITKEAVKAVKGLGFGFYHTEVILSKDKKPFLVETSPRISYATVALSRIVDNFYPVKQLINDCTGLKIYSFDGKNRAKKYFASLVHVIPEPGTFYNGYYDNYISNKPGLYEIIPVVKKGHKVKKFCTNADRVLYFVVYGISSLELQERVEKYKKEIIENAFN